MIFYPRSVGEHRIYNYASILNIMNSTFYVISAILGIIYKGNVYNRKRKEMDMVDLSLEEEKVMIDDCVIRAYLKDEFFESLKDYLNSEDYALAKDATKGLYVLAQKLELYDLYMALVDLYEDIDGSFYKDIAGHYEIMKEIHNRLLKEYED